MPIALLLVLGVAAYFLLRPVSRPIAQPTTPACPVVPDVVVGQLSVPAGPIGGYCQPELVNAAEIIRAAQRWRTTTQAMDIGVMTAIGESGLRNLGYGDAAGPDSRGLFQQRSNYGPVAQRMNPYSAAYAFFQRMLGIPGWQKLTPTQVAHTVQINAEPQLLHALLLPCRHDSERTARPSHGPRTHESRSGAPAARELERRLRADFG